MEKRELIRLTKNVISDAMSRADEMIDTFISCNVIDIEAAKSENVLPKALATAVMAELLNGMRPVKSKGFKKEMDSVSPCLHLHLNNRKLLVERPKMTKNEKAQEMCQAADFIQNSCLKRHMTTECPSVSGYTRTGVLSVELNASECSGDVFFDKVAKSIVRNSHGLLKSGRNVKGENRLEFLMHYSDFE